MNQNDSSRTNSRYDSAGDARRGRSAAESPDVDGGPRAESNAGDRETPEEFVASVVETAVEDPTVAGDRIGGLLAIARDHGGDAREAAGEALNLLGLLRPAEFAVWVDDLVAVANLPDGDLAFLALRALAQLASDDPRAAARGLDAAFDNLAAADPDLRRAALSAVAEVGAADPERVRRADRHVAAALTDADAGVRLAGALAAGKLLGADPRRFPRTATVLFDALDDEDDAVWEYAHVALVHFAQEHPSQVPDRKRAIEALADVSDAAIGVREGATKDALTTLLALGDGFDI